MRRPLTWSIAARAAACLILLSRCKNRAKAHKFNPSKLQNHDSFSSDFVLLLSRKLRKYQPQGSPLQPPAAPYVPSRCRKLRQRGGVLRNRGLLNGRSRRNSPEPLRRRCLQYEYLLGERVLIRSSLLTAPSGAVAVLPHIVGNPLRALFVKRLYGSASMPWCAVRPSAKMGATGRCLPAIRADRSCFLCGKLPSSDNDFRAVRSRDIRELAEYTTADFRPLAVRAAGRSSVEASE